MQVITLHGKVSNPEIRSPTRGFRERRADSGEYELTAQWLELAAKNYVDRVKRRVRFARSVADEPTTNSRRAPDGTRSAALLLGEAGQRQLLWRARFRGGRHHARAAGVAVRRAGWELCGL